jgi:ankyrin repeat protein
MNIKTIVQTVDDLEYAKDLIKNSNIMEYEYGMQLAYEISKIDFIRLFLENGASATLYENSITRHSLLYAAILHNNYELAELLLEYGADPNFGNKSPFYALESIKLGQLLLEKGCNVTNYNISEDVEPIDYNMNMEVCELLLSHGAIPSLGVFVNTFNNPRYSITMSKITFDKLKFVLEHCEDINEKHEVPLLSRFTDLKVVKLFMENEYNIDTLDSNNNTYLMAYLRHHNTNSTYTTYYVDMFDNLCPTNNRYEIDLELIKYVLDQGINVNALNNVGFTAMHYIKSNDVLNLLVKYNGNINLAKLKTPLHHYVSSSYATPELYTSMINHGAILHLDNENTFNKLPCIPVYNKDTTITMINAGVMYRHINYVLIDAIKTDNINKVAELLENTDPRQYFLYPYFVETERMAQYLEEHEYKLEEYAKYYINNDNVNVMGYLGQELTLKWWQGQFLTNELKVTSMEMLNVLNSPIKSWYISSDKLKRELAVSMTVHELEQINDDISSVILEERRTNQGIFSRFLGY